MSTEHAEDTTDESTPNATLDGAYDPEEVEPKWQQYWTEADVFAYESDNDTRFTIDTPPPTVSGSLHMGHLYQFTLQDFVARFHRMYDDTVYFPFGYDDNGIASERLTERELGIRHGDFERHEFQQKTRTVCSDYEDAFTEDVQSLAISIDWDNTYKTIEPRVQRISQLSFLDLYDQGKEYRQRAPTIWCPDCETAISQVEQEDAHRHTSFNDIEFPIVEAGDSEVESVTISTTRPELLPSCVSIFVHPDDEDHQHLVGGTAEVPLFGHEVPIIEDDRVDLETGSGVVMSCTFGDQTDIEWYQAYDLPLRIAIDESGTMTEKAGEYEGMHTKEARESIIADLETGGHLLESRDHEHTVQVHERCETEVEYLVTEQWYIDMLDSTDEYLHAGRQMDWYPEKMFTRYKHWIEGLEWDWCISRQRDSGIPFPVWYCDSCGEVILAERDDLPVDPLSDEPPVQACPECEGEDFVPEDDVFDTWATSSLTPLINADWDWRHIDPEETGSGAGEFTLGNPELYPMNLRPQGHDIISFWLFHTIVKCYEHTGEVPFETVMVNGMVLDENREAMSKSKGNVVSPEEVLEAFPVDAARYWAAGTSIGDDFPFMENDLEAGERLLQKLWNASKLVDQLAPQDVENPDDLKAIDRWLLANLDSTVESITDKLANYEFSKARNELRTFFWNTFCDDYLEIAKQRDDDSARFSLVRAHRTFLKLFAPFLPHVVEEIWQAKYADSDSIHVTDWPEPEGYDADLQAGEMAMDVIGALRRYKTDHNMALNADIDRVEVYGDVSGFESAIRQAMHVEELVVLEETPEITTEIVDVDLEYATVGPKYGDRVGDIEAALANEDYELEDGRLRVAGEMLEGEEFELEKQHIYAGEGELLETEHTAIIVDT